MSSRIAIVSPESKHQKRIELMGANLQVQSLIYSNDEQAYDPKAEIGKAEVVFLDATDASKENELAARIQTLRFAVQEGWVIVIADKRLKPEAAYVLKKNGAHGVLTEDEFLNSSKAEFIGSQRLHGQWIPMKSAEIVPGSIIPMTLYHFMPLNRKFVPVFPANTTMDEAKREKAMKTGELFFKRDDILLFHEYTKTFEDLTAAGLVSRCRRQYLAMNILYKDLVLHLIDQSEGVSFQKGTELMEQCRNLASDFMTSLASVGDAWQVVNNTGFDDLSPIDRASAIGATAGLLALLAEEGDTTEVFLSALLADIGLLDLHPRALGHLKKRSIQEMHPEDLAVYRNHPISSLHRLQERKIPLSQTFREIVQSTHEQNNKKGFPYQTLPERIPFESWVIHFAETLDYEMKVDFGVARRDPGEIRREVIQREIDTLEKFPLGFLLKVKKIL